MREWRRMKRREREGGESNMVWCGGCMKDFDTCHLISGALVVLDVLHLR